MCGKWRQKTLSGPIYQVFSVFGEIPAQIYTSQPNIQPAKPSAYYPLAYANLARFTFTVLISTLNLRSPLSLKIGIIFARYVANCRAKT